MAPYHHPPRFNSRISHCSSRCTFCRPRPLSTTTLQVSTQIHLPRIAEELHCTALHCLSSLKRTKAGQQRLNVISWALLQNIQPPPTLHTLPFFISSSQQRALFDRVWETMSIVRTARAATTTFSIIIFVAVLATLPWINKRQE